MLNGSIELMCEGMHPYLFVRPIHCDKSQSNMLYGKGKNSMIHTYWAVLVQEQNTLFSATADLCDLFD